MKLICFFFLFFPLIGWTDSPERFGLSVRRIQAQLLLEEVNEAVLEAKALQKAFPDNSLAHELLIKSLSLAGEEGEMMRNWEAFRKKFPEQAEERELLEEMCWGILLKGRKAGGLTTKLISLLGSAMTQQMRAVALLKEGMRNSNSHIRAIAVQLSAVYADQSLREEIVRLFREEKVWDVQQEILQAIGKLKMQSLLPELLNRLKNFHLSNEERKEVINTIANLREVMERDELEILIKNRRSIFRMLGAEAIAKNGLEEHADLLNFLLVDPQPEVRITALEAWGLLRLPTKKEIENAAESSVAEISITAAWVLLIQGNTEGGRVLDKWLKNENQEYRLLAAGAIVKAGKYGIPIALEQIEKSSDPYLRANMALALLQQRVECEKACAELDAFLQSCHDRLMWQEGFFAPLHMSTVDHKAIIPNYPEVINQTVRLEILNLLSILEYPGAIDAIKRFLKESRWGVTGAAAEMLLGEGDETALELVKELMQDPDKEIRTEAALVLASWGQDPSALPVLMQVYHQGDRMLKLKVLESLGRIGDASSIPFLIERLKEPSQILRTVAACVLIQTLNH